MLENPYVLYQCELFLTIEPFFQAVVLPVLSKAAILSIYRDIQSFRLLQIAVSLTTMKFFELVQCKVKNNRSYHLFYSTNTFSKSSFGMNNRGPRIWNIQKKSINIQFLTFQTKSLRNHISPCRSNLFKLQIFKKLLGYFVSLLVELESKEVPFFFDSLSNCTRKRP